MKRLLRRIELAETRTSVLAADIPEECATVRWLKLLKIFEKSFNQKPTSPENDVILDRIRRSIAMIEEFESPPLNAVSHAYLEYYWQACIYRLSWKGDWVGRELAFAEEDYDEHMAEIEQIERGRWEPLGVRNQADATVCEPQQ